jgi:hypothetical protein
MNTSEISQLMDKHDIKTFSNMDDLNAEIGYELSRLTGFKFEMCNSFQINQHIFAFPAENLIQFIKNNPSYQNNEVEDDIDMSALFDVEEIQEQFKTKEELEKLFENGEYNFHFYLLDLDKLEGVLLMTQ